jgi:NAD+ kinase
MPPFQTIGIIGKQGEATKVKATIERLVAFLRGRRREVFFDPVSAEILGAGAAPVLDHQDIGKRCSLAIVVGGDGTLLHAARSLAQAGVPLLGINLGRLGFLVDVSPSDIETSLDRILKGECDAEARSMLAARVNGADPYSALNDVVIHKWNTARMIEFETYVDGAFVNVQRSDGVIVSTPTGSTAYALSGGGPLLHPRLDVIVLVPICPHTLSNRPLVVGGSSRIEIRVCGFDQGHARITCDGQTDLALLPDSRVLVERSPYPARLLHPKGHDHFDILRAKLGWGGHPPTAQSC